MPGYPFLARPVRAHLRTGLDDHGSRLPALVDERRTRRRPVVITRYIIFVSALTVGSGACVAYQSLHGHITYAGTILLTCISLLVVWLGAVKEQGVYARRFFFDDVRDG